MSAESTTTENVYLEYAVEMFDIDASNRTVANDIWLVRNERTEEAYQENAHGICKKKYSHMFAGNTVEYNSQGWTGRSMKVTVTKIVDIENPDQFVGRVVRSTIITEKVMLTDYSEDFNAKSFFKMEDY